MRSPLIYSFLSFFGLIIFYFLIMGLLSRSWSATLSQFRVLWGWMLAISLTFAAQVYLYLSLRKISISATNSQMVTTSAATSTFSMIVCCAHHAADFLPLLGFSALSLFLVNYQKPILTLSLALNIFAVLFMLRKFLGAKRSLLNQL